MLKAEIKLCKDIDFSAFKPQLMRI